MEYTSKIYNEARLVAIQAHGNQTYDGIYPYVKHLDDVVSVIKRFGFSGKYIVGGFLHDSIEDGAISYNKIKTAFGYEVAEMVFLVTDEMGRNRREKKVKTLPKTGSHIDGIILKLADRIANIEHGGKVDMYKKEYDDFCIALRRENQGEQVEAMWDCLDKLLGVMENYWKNFPKHLLEKL